MLPRVDIVRWRAVALWADDDDVEQDLVITLALFDIFHDETLKSAVALRGGTALHKLHLPPAARYSEDIDLVQREPGPIGPTLSRAAAGRPMIRVSELRANLAAKRTPGFLEEVRPLLRPGIAYDAATALDWAEATFIPLLP